ncbi:MAG: efflux RND transporter periplasmic adaptor subunit [Synergistota bacterium]|nr:efflux RND transporter periplasmic adaptor subunit [Synergistota bacterium]
MAARNRHRWIWGVVLLGLVAFVAWRIVARPEKETPVSVADIRAREGVPVTVTEVCQGAWEHWITLYGRVVAAGQVTVAADRQEYIREVKVDVGDSVRAGQTLLVLDRRTTLENMEAQKAREVEARNKYQRLKSLQQAGGASSQEVEGAYASSQEASARLQELRTALGRLTVNSPTDGVVSARNAEVGDLVSPGQMLFTVADLNALEAELDVSPSDAVEIAVGLPARVMTPNGWIYAKIKRVNPTADPVTGLFTVVLSLPPMSGLSPGQTVRGMIQDEALVDAISIPYEALQQLGNDEHAVFVLSDDVAVERNVIPGETFNGGVRILSGLEPCDTVIVKGSDRLFPGAGVWVQED